MVTLMSATEQDDAFLKQVYASTRTEELAAMGLDALGGQAFVDLQFKARRMDYQRRFPQARWEIIHHQGQAAGYWCVDRGADEFRLVDIALLPACRAQRVGTDCVRALMEEARAACLPLRLHVFSSNPARRLYERLGFVASAAQGLFLPMQWQPSGA